VLQHVEHPDDVEGSLWVPITYVSGRDGAADPAPGVFHSLTEQLNSEHGPAGALTFEDAKDVAGAAAHLKDPVAGRQWGHEAPYHCRDDAVADAKPEVSILGLHERREVTGIEPSDLVVDD
jgi:hypothetical protein